MSDSDHEIVDLKLGPGELSFEARVGGQRNRVWFRTGTPVEPNADAALATCLMPAMHFGGTLTMSDPVSPRLLRNQREFQSFQRAWSLRWPFGETALHEVEVFAPTRAPQYGPASPGRVAAFYSGGVDSWANILNTPGLTDLIFVRGFDLMLDVERQESLMGGVEARLREGAGNLGLTIHVVETNLRRLSDPLIRWESYYGCALDTVALFLAPLFERVVVAGDMDHEVQPAAGVSRMIDALLSTENLEIIEAGGRFNRVERLQRIASHPTVQQTLRVCWENPDGAYNCGRCRKCLWTTIALEVIGARDQIKTFPPDLHLDWVSKVTIDQHVHLNLWEDLLDAVRESGRVHLEQTVEGPVARGKQLLGIPLVQRARAAPGPPPTVRIAVIVPAYRQTRFMAAAIQSALDQELLTGVGVVVVNDGCPDPGTHRIGQAFRDAHPDRVTYLRQPNRGLSAARNAGIRRALTRWPHIEQIFPLDADNLLSPETLARLRDLLERRPDAAWASPTLEFFGCDEGSWGIQEPFLSYRQLFSNQSDAGSLIRREVFDAGIEFDESMREGFEDWEFFLHASLKGLRGAPAGRCGFLYRRREHSMLSEAKPRAAAIEAHIRELHAEAYRPGALARREHAEAPRFALVRCDRGDALLTAACDLPPHRAELRDLLRPRPSRGAADSPPEAHVPAITVLTTDGTLKWLQERGLLADTLLRMQEQLRNVPAVGLRVERRARRHAETAPVEKGGLAMRTRVFAEHLVAGVPLPPEKDDVVVHGRGRLPAPLPNWALKSALSTLSAGLRPGHPPFTEESQAQYLEYLHLDLGQTTMPLAEAATSEGASEALAK